MSSERMTGMNLSFENVLLAIVVIVAITLLTIAVAYFDARRRGRR